MVKTLEYLYIIDNSKTLVNYINIKKKELTKIS